MTLEPLLWRARGGMCLEVAILLVGGDERASHVRVAEEPCGSEEGSCVSLIDLCITMFLKYDIE